MQPIEQWKILKRINSNKVAVAGYTTEIATTTRRKKTNALEEPKLSACDRARNKWAKFGPICRGAGLEQVSAGEMRWPVSRISSRVVILSSSQSNLMDFERPLSTCGRILSFYQLLHDEWRSDKRWTLVLVLTAVSRHSPTVVSTVEQDGFRPTVWGTRPGHSERGEACCEYPAVIVCSLYRLVVSFSVKKGLISRTCYKSYSASYKAFVVNTIVIWLEMKKVESIVSIIMIITN